MSKRAHSFVRTFVSSVQGCRLCRALGRIIGVVSCGQVFGAAESVDLSVQVQVELRANVEERWCSPSSVDKTNKGLKNDL